MRIKRLEIYGYGKWVDQTFNLDDGLQIFLGENEAGKSTLMSFIHSIFFGFPTRNSSLLRYEPLESSRYGGKIIAEDQQLGEVIIERIHGKVTGDVTVTLEDGSTGSDLLLERILKGIDRENYQSIFSFSLRDIENVDQLNKNKLSRYLLNIGAHSTDYYLDLVDEFQKNAYNLYRPSGRIPPLNKELSIIKKQEKKLKKIEARNESYLDLINKNNQENEELEKTEEEIERLNKRIKELEELEKDLHLLEEIQQLKKEIKKTQLPILKKDGPYLLEENKKSRREIHDELTTLRNTINSKKKKLLKANIIESYQANEKQIKKLEQDLPDKIEELEALKRIEEKITNNKKIEKEIKELLRMENKASELITFTTEEKLEVKELVESYTKRINKLEKTKNEIEALEVQIAQRNEKADYYEELMWDPQYLMQVQKQIEEQKDLSPKKEKKQSKKVAFVFAFVGLMLTISSFFISSVDQIIIAGLGVLTIVFSLIYYQSRTNKNLNSLDQSADSFALLIKEYKNQLNIQSDWQNLLAEIDAIQSNYQENKNEIDRNLNFKNELSKKWRMLLNRHHIPAIHSIEKAEELVNETNKLISLKDSNRKLKGKKEELESKLENDFIVLENIITISEELSLIQKMNHFRQYLREVNELIDLEQSKMSELTLHRYQEKDLLNKRETLKVQMNHLFDAAGIKTEEEFLLLYNKQRGLEKKKSRMKFLIENTSSFNTSKKLPTKKELLNKKEEIKLELKRLNKESKIKIDERAKTQLAIHNLEKDGRYSEALQEFENQKERTQKLVDEWISDKLAAAIIQSTLKQVTKDRFEEIITEINQYFSYLTANNYRNILFKDEELFVQNNEGRVIAVKKLSRGTAEPLYVAIRLAYIVKLQDVIKLPIIMDDPFVNFDDERKNKMNRLLDHLSDRIQIIYFSFDQDLEKEFTAQQIIKLEE